MLRFSLVVAIICVFLMVQNLGLTKGYPFYWIVSYTLVKIFFLLLIAFVYKVYLIEWARQVKRSTIRFLFEKLVYPAVTVLIITSVDGAGVVLSGAFVFTQVILFFVLMDVRRSLAEECERIADSFVAKYPRKKPFNAKDDLLIMHFIVNVFFALLLFKFF